MVAKIASVPQRQSCRVLEPALLCRLSQVRAFAPSNRSAVAKLASIRKEPDEAEQQEETEEETNDDFENLYKGQISKSGVAILPSKRTRRIPEVKKLSLADEALNELKAEQPEVKEENLETEEAPLELSEEAPTQEEPAQEKPAQEEPVQEEPAQEEPKSE